ncbi:MAG: helix-turn-helix domain-containing protein [Cyanophyceae cyanobacterium]
MSGIIKLESEESAAELRELLKAAKNQEVKERVQTLYWLKTRQVKTTETTASLLGKHRTTVSRWLSRYRQGGISALLLKGKSSGRKRALCAEVEEKLMQELKDEAGFSSYKEVQRWLKAVHEVDMSYTGVHKLVRYRLKGKLKVPRPVHHKQEPGVVEAFKKAEATQPEPLLAGTRPKQL